MRSNVIYCIPGLGLTCKVFKKLKIPSAQLKFIDFIPAHPSEKLADYAERICAQIKDDEFSLLGMSLGGMLAIEIARIKKVHQLFLISTIKNTEERPNILKYLDKIPKNDTLAAKIAVSTSMRLKPYYDHSDAEGIELFKEMLSETPYELITWGWKVVSTWNFCDAVPAPFYHIHGTADLVFPIKHINKAETLKGGTHYMIYNNAEEIAQRIESYLQLKHNAS